ncbi:MAG: protein kinase [Cyanobacteria bacterium J06633_2]
MLCSKGHSNPPDSIFCRLCGEQLVARRQPDVASSDPTIPPQSSGPQVGLRYRITRQVGHGGFGRTYLAEDDQRFREPCVLKEFAPRVDDPDALQKAEQLFEREAGVLYRLNHPQIPQFRELLRAEFEGRDRLFLVQDYVAGSTYQDELDARIQQGKSFTEPEILEFLSQILPVLDYIHNMGVIHRDIAPDNLILRDSDQYPVLIDFGGVKQAATTIESELRRSQHPAPEVTLVGKQGFAPKEQMQDGTVSPHCDLYALAVTVLVLMTGQSPRDLLNSSSPTYWMEQLVKPGKIGSSLSSVLSRMLSDRPSDRYASAQQVMKALGFLRVKAQASVPPTNQASVNQAAQVHPNAANHPPNAQQKQNPAPPQRAPKPIATAHTVAVSPAKSASAAQPRTRPAPPPPPQAPLPQPLPPPSSKPTQSASSSQADTLTHGVLAFLIIVLLAGVGGWVGYRWIPQWLNIGQSETATNRTSDESGQDLDEPSTQIPPEEQSRKTSLRSRRDDLGVNTAFLVGLTDAQFYATYPRQQGRQLTDNPDDAIWRERWDEIAADWLDQLESSLSLQARRQLGSYDGSDRAEWRQIVNRLFVSSAALNDLVDARFFHQFPEQRNQPFIEQPIGQIWHGMADDQVRSIQAGNTLTNIQFAPGGTSYEVSGELAPGEGAIYTLDLREDQRMDVAVDASQNSARLSLYVPQPTDTIPALLEDSRSLNWSGALPQSGYYEITLVSVSEKPTRFRMIVSVE